MKLLDTSTRKKLYIFIIASIRTQYFYSTWVFWISRGCLCNRYEPCAINGKHGGSTERWTPWLVEVVSGNDRNRRNQHYNSCITQKYVISWIIKWRIYHHVMQFKCIYIIQVLHQHPHNYIHIQGSWLMLAALTLFNFACWKNLFKCVHLTSYEIFSR
jgi:hypothetical protein